MSWQSIMVPGAGPDAQPIVSVIAKKTWQIAMGQVRSAEEQLPLNHNDIPINPDNPFYSEIFAESDIVACKPKTDVVVIGAAHAPNGKTAYHLSAEVHVGTIQKKITVYGNRTVESKTLRGLSFSDPAPFTSMSTGFVNAYGGRAKSKEGTLFIFPPNPLGKGFFLKGGFGDVSELVVPNLEDPASPITADHIVLGKYEEWIDAPVAASFGFTRPGFFPRYTYAGILPEMLAGAMNSKEAIDPHVPHLDFRFFQGASAGMCNVVCAGNEHVRLVYMDPDYPTFEFDLPGKKPVMVLLRENERVELGPVLQTILINKDENMLSMVWRGSCASAGVEEFAQGLSYIIEDPNL